MLPFHITKYFIALTTVTFLSIAETNAQYILDIGSFNNFARSGSMNNNVPGAGNAIRNQAGPGAAAGQVQITTTSSPFGSLSPLLALLLASNLNGGGSPYPYYPYYGGYGAYGPYIPYYYYSGYPYYYYYYYYRG